MPKSPVVVVPVESSTGYGADGARGHQRLHEGTAPRCTFWKSSRLVRLCTSMGVRTQSRAAVYARTHDRSRLTRSSRSEGSRTVKVRTVAYRGDAARIIPSYAQLVKAHLLVMGQHYGTPRWRRNTRLVGTLSRAAPCSVLILPAGLSPRLRRVHSRTLFRRSILRSRPP